MMHHVIFQSLCRLKLLIALVTLDYFWSVTAENSQHSGSDSSRTHGILIRYLVDVLLVIRQR